MQTEEEFGCGFKREEVELKKSTNAVSDRVTEMYRELGCEREE